MTQNELIDRATRAIAIPRENAADSFVLHAPLNLMARAGLLAYLDDAGMPAAEAAIERVVRRYEASGPPVSAPAGLDVAGASEAAGRLVAAIAAGELDDVDAYATWLTDRCSTTELGHLLGETVIDSLAAAGHAPIGFHLLQRARGGTLHPSLLRGTLRELARHPEWKMHWFRNIPTADYATTLDQALGALPFLGRPGSDFIFPLMSQIDSSGVGARVLGPALRAQPDIAHARGTLMRVAALSMLNGDRAHVPYGWTHCFTMAQGAMSLAGHGVEPQTAIAVAATFIAGFRVAYSAGAVGSLADDRAAEHASGHAFVDERTLATFASQHDDEHLVKYTLACFHAAEVDPAWRSVYLHAAAYLADWWRANPTATFG
jgi:hypothetical protein